MWVFVYTFSQIIFSDTYKFLRMSPFFGKIALIICGAIIFSSLLFILNKIHSIEDDWEQEDTQPHGLMRQHGNYWVWHDYIRRKDSFKGNKSITLTTHSTYMDLGLLTTLIDRWVSTVDQKLYLGFYFSDGKRPSVCQFMHVARTLIKQSNLWHISFIV